MSYFYGDDSRKFWDWINKHDGRLHGFLYSIGVELQNIEWKLRHRKCSEMRTTLTCETVPITAEFPPVPKRSPRNGYQPTHGDLDTSNPPQCGSGVPTPKQAVTCPVCHGTGHVVAGLYEKAPVLQPTHSGFESCKSCDGKGFVVI